MAVESTIHKGDSHQTKTDPLFFVFPIFRFPERLHSKPKSRYQPEICQQPNSLPYPTDEGNAVSIHCGIVGSQHKTGHEVGALEIPSNRAMNESGYRWLSLAGPR